MNHFSFLEYTLYGHSLTSVGVTGSMDILSLDIVEEKRDPKVHAAACNIMMLILSSQKFDPFSVNFGERQSPVGRYKYTES